MYSSIASKWASKDLGGTIYFAGDGRYESLISSYLITEERW